MDPAYNYPLLAFKAAARPRRHRKPTMGETNSSYPSTCTRYHSQASKPTGQPSRSGIPSARATPHNPALKRYLPGPGVDMSSPRIYHLHSSEVSSHRMLPKNADRRPVPAIHAAAYKHHLPIAMLAYPRQT
ncbi:Hypothetical predicted protein [Pelobates cultripes]|uniref:Uncharacterized protein n=1 Tax=Pelobates cultripes TaxID=61616 RepID=A0AAD1W6C0_PELCU|nr:Hypothetical predicted protein [Pelobates cultripes]